MTTGLFMFSLINQTFSLARSSHRAVRCLSAVQALGKPMKVALHSYKSAFVLSASLLLTACAGGPPLPPITIAESVDIPQFMGDWYVIANIPTALEKNIYNAVENYELKDNNVVATTFTFNKGSFDGPKKEYNPTGFIYDHPSNAIWGMRFIWPIKADYRIVYVDDSYQVTIIGREKRDYVWIMARTPQIPESVYQDLLSRVENEGYDMSKVRLVPQQTTKD